jgi:hypothetical protein
MPPFRLPVVEVTMTVWDPVADQLDPVKRRQCAIRIDPVRTLVSADSEIHAVSAVQNSGKTLPARKGNLLHQHRSALKQPYLPGCRAITIGTRLHEFQAIFASALGAICLAAVRPDASSANRAFGMRACVAGPGNCAGVYQVSRGCQAMTGFCSRKRNKQSASGAICRRRQRAR